MKPFYFIQFKSKTKLQKMHSLVIIKITVNGIVVKFPVFFDHFDVKNRTFGAKPL